MRARTFPREAADNSFARAGKPALPSTCVCTGALHTLCLMTSLVPRRARCDIWAHYAEQREGNITVEPASLTSFLRPRQFGMSSTFVHWRGMMLGFDRTLSLRLHAPPPTFTGMSFMGSRLPPSLILPAAPARFQGAYVHNGQRIFPFHWYEEFNFPPPLPPIVK